MANSRAATLVLAGLVFAWPASAVEERPDWHKQLEAQMRVEHGCLIAFITGAQRRDVEGRSLVSAHIHCEDGRSFEATRLTPEPRFEIAESAMSGC